MAKNNSIASLWNGIPAWGKLLIIGGGAFVAYKFGKKLISSSRLDATTRDAKQEEDGWNSVFQQSVQSGDKTEQPSLSKVELKSMANIIETSMDGRGTDEDAIYNVFRRLQNNADFAGLQAAFGTRTIDSGYFWDSDFKGSLISCINEEMDSSEKGKLNNILKSKGIKYRV
jgi:hypothetical protein